MQKVDIAIAVVGALALLTTGLGIAFYDDLAGQDDYVIVTGLTAYDQQGDPVSSTPTVFTFDAPNNTYGSTFDIGVSIGGPGQQAFQGTATVTATIESFNGMVSEDCVGTGTGASGNVALTCAHDGWVEIPEDGTYSEPTSQAGGPVKVTITVTYSGAAPVLENPTFTATVSGSAMTYAFTQETADPEAI